jgi:hypothetical protein
MQVEARKGEREGDHADAQVARDQGWSENGWGNGWAR